MSSVGLRPPLCGPPVDVVYFVKNIITSPIVAIVSEHNFSVASINDNHVSFLLNVSKSMKLNKS